MTGIFTDTTPSNLSEISIFPLGDSAITAELNGGGDEELNSKALAMQAWLFSSILSRSFPGIHDVLVAYHTVSIFYDPVLVREGLTEGGGHCRDGAYGCIHSLLEQAWRETPLDPLPDSSHDGAHPGAPAFDPIRVPVCYGGEFGPDLYELAREKGLSPQEGVQLHCGQTYRVYMVGFLPGFPYLGMVDRRLQASRKEKPVAVKAGSVGIAGRQTGIYPVDSPGGWRIIGRTPWKLFEAEAEMPIRLKTGDLVQFFPITPEEFDADRPAPFQAPDPG